MSLAGLGLSTYLAVMYVSGHSPACGPSGGCEAVTASDYAVFLGVPVALLGVVGYSALLLGSLALLGLQDVPTGLRPGLLLVSTLGVAFSIYLTALQRFVLDDFCVYCLTSASLMVLILSLTITATMLARGSAGAASQAEVLAGSRQR